MVFESLKKKAEELKVGVKSIYLPKLEEKAREIGGKAKSGIETSIQKHKEMKAHHELAKMGVREEISRRGRLSQAAEAAEAGKLRARRLEREKNKKPLNIQTRIGSPSDYMFAGLSQRRRRTRTSSSSSMIGSNVSAYLGFGTPLKTTKKRKGKGRR